MTRTEEVMLKLLAAATELAESRRHDSDTCEEWDALERAITAAEESTEPSYAFEDGCFVRHSRLATALPDDATVCAIDVADLEIVARTIEEDADPYGNGWFVVDELVAPSGLTWTRCLVAIECMKRLGLIRERAVDNRLSKAEGFSIDAVIAAFRSEAGLPAV